MKIKVQCSCGSRFEFEAEPVEGRMPWALNCPTCNADATALANEVIHQQLAAAPKRLVIAKVHNPASEQSAAPAHAPAAPVPPAAGRLKIAGHQAPAPAATPAAEAPASGAATIASGKIYREVKAAPKSRSGALATTITLSVLAIAALGAWGWYAWVGSMPKKVYSQSLAKGSGDESEPIYHLVGPGQLVSLDGEKMTMYDVPQKKELWSVSTAATGQTDSRRYRTTPPARTDAAKPAPPAKGAETPSLSNPEIPAMNQVSAALAGLNAKGGAPAMPSATVMSLLASFVDFQMGRPTVIANTNDIWLLYPNRVAHFDGATGVHKEEIQLQQPVISLTHNDDSILAVSQPDLTHKVITQVSLATGATQSEEIDLVPPKPVRPGVGVPPRVAAPAPVPAQAAGGRRSRTGTPARTPTPAPIARAAAPVAPTNSAPPLDHANAQFIPCGANATELVVKLVEHLTATSDAMKPKGKPILDNPNMTASQSMAASQELLNDMKRQGGGGRVTEDVSRYQVTLHRLFVKDVPDWTGEVVGPPEFFPMKNVDVLASGTVIRVFDKNNHKNWEAKLTYPVGGRPPSEDGRPIAPCLEAGDTLYFADKGMLTAFDAATGDARWRVTSVGISKIQLDDRGDIYVNTTTADPDTIQYSEQVDIQNHPKPVVMKIDAKTGKTLWKAENVGESCILTGKFVYSTRVSSSYAWLKMEEGPQTHYNIYRLNPSNGHTMWNYYQPEAGVRAEANKNWIMLQFGDQLQVVKYFSL